MVATPINLLIVTSSKQVKHYYDSLIVISSILSLNWICGFSIPLITICAFFVLNIFLILLNIVFFWLPFIKICIPFPIPVPSTSED